MKTVLIAVICACALTTTVFAEERAAERQPSPEEMKQLMELSMGAMVPVMGKMTESIVEAQLAIAERPETAARIATFKKNIYDALIKKGFSKKEAFDIMLNTSIPSAMPGMK